MNTTGIEQCFNEEFSKFCIIDETNDQNYLNSSFECAFCTKPNDDYCYENITKKQCDAVLLGNACIQTSRTITSETVQDLNNMILFYNTGREPDMCYTIKTSDSIERGCFRKYPTPLICETAKDNCHVCSVSNCNSKQYNGLRCMKCDSRIDEECLENPRKYGYCISDDDDEVVACVLREYCKKSEKY